MILQAWHTLCILKQRVTPVSMGYQAYLKRDKIVNHLEHNLKLLRQYRPLVFQRIEPFLKAPCFTWIGSNKENISFQSNGNKITLYESNFENCWQEAVKISKLNDPRVLVVHGIGLGDLVFRFINEESVRIKHILLVEKNASLFIAALEKRDWREIITSSRFEIFVAFPTSLMTPALRDYFLLMDRVIFQGRIEHFYCPPLLKYDGPYYLEFAQSIPKAVSSLQSLYMAPSEDAYRGFINVNRNLPKLHKYWAVDNLKERFSGKPAVIVSSGPSLSLHLQNIKKNQDKMIIGCSDSSLKLLLEKGIRPDFAFCLERDRVIEDLFKDFPKDCDVPLVTMPMVYPGVLQNYPGPVLMASRSSAFGCWLWPQRTFFDFGNTVATMALRLFCFMGCSEVYFLGQDLAYDRESELSHAVGISDDAQDVEQSRKKTFEYRQLEGNDGTLIDSTVYWEMFRNTLNMMMSKFRTPCYNVIPKSYGAKIQNAIRMEPDDFWKLVTTDWEIEKSRETLEEFLRDVQKENCSKLYYKQLVDRSLSYVDELLKASLIEMDEISEKLQRDYPEKYSREVLNDYHQAFEKWEGRQEEFKNIDRELFKHLIRPILASYHFRILTERENLRPQEGNYINYILEYSRLSLEWYQCIQSWCLRIKNRLEGISW